VHGSANVGLRFTGAEARQDAPNLRFVFISIRPEIDAYGISTEEDLRNGVEELAVLLPQFFSFGSELL